MASRRAFLALTGTAAAALLPHSWIKPVVETVIVPAHAQSSPIETTTVTETTATETTATETTATETTATETTGTQQPP